MEKSRSGAYDALIDEHEDRAPLDCGCILWRLASHGPVIVAFKYCGAHQEPVELMIAARALVELWNHPGKMRDFAMMKAIQRLRLALDKQDDS